MCGRARSALGGVVNRDGLSLEENNFAFQGRLTCGEEVQIRTEDGSRGDLVWLIDFEQPDRNDWLVVIQLTIVNGKYNRLPDLVVFVNGLPLAVIELKNPKDVNATIKSAWNQLQTYKSQISVIFDTNELLVISDGTEVKVGSLTAGFEKARGDRAIKLRSGSMSEYGALCQVPVRSGHILYTFSLPVILPVCRSIRPRTVL